MDAETAERRLLELWGDIADLDAATSALHWDQETMMPPAGAEARGHLLSTMAGLRHRLVTADELGQALADAAAVAAEGSLLAAQVREAGREFRRARAVPESLARALAAAQAEASEAWRRAREAADFAPFEGPLTTLVALRREEAAALSPDGDRYEALMERYEPGSRVAELAPLFEALTARLATLVRAVREEGREVDLSPVRGHFPSRGQLALGTRIVRRMGYDLDAGRIDRSTHPFCTSVGYGDVRITWRHAEDDLRPALMGLMHEAGHALYEQGLPEAWRRTPLGNATSLGVHESQSRMWENLVGRSRPFWRWALPLLHEHLPGTAGVTVDALWRALHTVEPSPIRVEADEATYNLHIAVRFELERALIGGDLEVSELPAAWDDRYEALLGLRPRDPAEGVLQDIHWGIGHFGYFHTYTLGNLIAAQLFDAARGALGDLDAQLARGELAPLREWLRDEVHCHGSRYPGPELVERITGTPLSPRPFLEYIEGTTAEVYGISSAGGGGL